VLAAVSRSPGNAVIGDIPEPGPPLAGWAVVRPEAAGIRGSGCNIIPAIPSVLSGARDYCPRIPGHEFCAVAAAGGSAAPSSRTPGTPGSGLRERLDLAASTAYGADDPGTGCAAAARAGADRGARRRAGPRHRRGAGVRSVKRREGPKRDENVF